jgi:hypothetical protein
MVENKPKQLHVLWTNGEKDTAINMVFMYTINSLKYTWWDEVTLLVWGAATRLVSEDAEVQSYIQKAKEAGVRVLACKKCAENMDVVAVLEGLGVEVFYTGTLLSEWLQSDIKLLSI